MNFLSPWFLLGALAIAGPIIFHLIRRAARERVPFSSVMFLRPTPPRVTRRRRLEHISLLLLRCLALILLAAGFARPFFVRESTLPEAVGSSRQTVILIDTSASLRRDDLWIQAQSKLRERLAEASAVDEIAIVAFDRRPRTVVTFNEWSSWAIDERAALARDRVSTLTPGWMGTQLGLAVTTAAGLFDDSTADKAAARREIVIISDLQDGARLEGLQGYEWPTRTAVILDTVDSKRANAGFEVITPSSARGGAQTNVQIRVANSRNSTQERFRVDWTDQPGTAGGQGMEIYLAPGQTRTFSVPRDTSTQSGMLRLSGDQDDFDNRAWFASPEPERLIVASVGSGSLEDPNQPAFYLQHVYPESARRQIKLVQHSVGNPLSPAALDETAFLFITDSLDAAQAGAVRRWIESGKTALVVLTHTRMAPTLAALSGTGETRLTESEGGFALLGEIDFAHPIFAPFADPRFSDFTRIHFWKHRKWELPENFSGSVLARFDDRSPAFVHVPVGEGNLLVLASGWNPPDSQLAVSSKFPPLMQLLLDWSGASVPLRFQFVTGDSIPSPVRLANADAADQKVEWRKPDGSREVLAAGVAFSGTDTPGLYSAVFGGTERRYAVNLPLDESRTAQMAPDELSRLGVPLQTSQSQPAITLARQQQLHLSELENRQKLWRWLIVGVLMVTFLEITLGGWFSRRITTAKAAA